VDPQEPTEELEHPGARNLLDSATLLRLAYNGSDGFPRVIPIGFYWNGSQIVVDESVYRNSTPRAQETPAARDTSNWIAPRRARVRVSLAPLPW